MQGTSPFSHQSQSFHSSSYQPKLEADFMRDFSCCGLTLATLHDLLEHYEDNHNQEVGELQRKSSASGPPPDPKAAIAANAAAAIKDPQSQHKSKPATPQRSNTPIQTQKTPTQGRYPVSSNQDDETIGNMEMEDDFPQSALQNYTMTQPRRSQASQFGQPANRAPPLDMSRINGSNAYVQHQGLRKTTPTTPVSGGTPYYTH